MSCYTFSQLLYFCRANLEVRAGEARQIKITLQGQIDVSGFPKNGYAIVGGWLRCAGEDNLRVPNPCLDECNIGRWEEWEITNCTKTCDGGVFYSMRECVSICDNETIVENCPGTSHLCEDCNTHNCTYHPTDAPTNAPSDNPTDNPTNSPTDAPTNVPSDVPTNSPTNAPTDSPTDYPTDNPTNSPTNSPTDFPTNSPTNNPTDNPTDAPSNVPTNAPTRSPSDIPTNSPTNNPTNSPTNAPNNSPTHVPTDNPTVSPTNAPTPCPEPEIPSDVCLIECDNSNHTEWDIQFVTRVYDPTNDQTSFIYKVSTANVNPDITCNLDDSVWEMQDAIIGLSCDCVPNSDEYLDWLTIHMTPQGTVHDSYWHWEHIDVTSGQSQTLNLTLKGDIPLSGDDSNELIGYSIVGGWLRCTTIKIPVPNPCLDVCQTGEWTHWSFTPCSASCGGGYQIAMRECHSVCDNQTTIQNCDGPSHDLLQCNTHQCP